MAVLLSSCYWVSDCRGSVGANVVDVTVGALVVSVVAAVNGWLCC